jgi:[ribosomal protein S5]-alanine N-acetyltransferase
MINQKKYFNIFECYNTMRIPDKIKINEHYYLSHTPSVNDIDTLLENLNDPEIYNGTLRIPRPYTREDADAYIKSCAVQHLEFGYPMKWQVRDKSGRMAGSITLHNQYGKGSHKDEIGYWIGKAHRNKGLMTDTLKVFSELVFTYYEMIRLEATIFDYNTASQRAVEKCGFIYEGTLKKAYFKDGKYIDGKLFALVK